MPEKFIEQFLRVERWFTRLQNAVVAHPQVRPIDEDYYLDDLYSFFVNCYHLKDWIEKDEAIICTKSEIESFLAKNDYLKLCANLCNSSKHLVLKSRGRSQQSPKVTEPIITVSVAINPSEREAKASLFKADGQGRCPRPRRFSALGIFYLWRFPAKSPARR